MKPRFWVAMSSCTTNSVQNQKADIDTSAALAALAESLAQLQTLQNSKPCLILVGMCLKTV